MKKRFCLVCMAGGLAKIIYPIPKPIKQKAISFLDTEMKKLITDYCYKLGQSK